MKTRVKKVSQAQRRQAAVRRRDDALGRLSSTTAAIAVATITAVGAFGLYLAKAFPGHSAAPTGTVAGSGGAATGGATGGTGNTGTQAGGSAQVQTPLQPPSTPVQGSSGRPRITSGAS